MAYIVVGTSSKVPRKAIHKCFSQKNTECKKKTTVSLHKSKEMFCMKPVKKNQNICAGDSGGM